jgi:uncharacterized protein involved in exopolysaccharide biosynthesis
MAGNPNSQLKSIATLLCLAGSAVVAVGLAYLFFTPKTYSASAKIRMRNWVRSDATNGAQNTIDLPAECRAVCSNEILDQTIKNLGLNELWSKRLNQGAPLKSEQTRALLKERLDVHPGSRSEVIEIRAASPDSNEAAKVANEVARQYHDKRQTQRRALNSERLTQFKHKWEEQGEKVRQAQEALEKLYLAINQNRATNPAAMREAILSNRIDLESQYVAQRDELERLKALKPELLRQVLPTLVTDTNSLLTKSLTRRSKARTDLVLAQSTYAPDSKEVKDAAQVVNELDQSINQEIAGVMAARETKVLSLKAALDDMDQKLKQASGNPHEISDQDATYARARKTVEDLKQERDTLQEKIYEEESYDAIMPAAVVPEIIDSAEPPAKPAIPNGKVAATAMSVGMLAALAGLVLLLTSQGAKPTPRKL